MFFRNCKSNVGNCCARNPSACILPTTSRGERVALSFAVRPHLSRKSLAIALIERDHGSWCPTVHEDTTPKRPASVMGVLSLPLIFWDVHNWQ